ncbi:Torsin-1A-interacting protein 2 [Bagarius yarrelli]|uniref:Torsin-1A-interacting protein 2 n=1 Tax=Bagarius yarrelli TaxID=175774 RepID=A0A556U7X9_BAGYA|nr:Torsin-1A-interacting protein 2 [Bagarius yarrelli]
MDVKRDGTDSRRITRQQRNKGSPEKISKVRMEKGAEDEHENGDPNNTVEMDVEEPEDQTQDMSSEDEIENSKPPIQEKKVNRPLRLVNLETDEKSTFLLQRRKTHQKSQKPESSERTDGGDAVKRSQNFSRESSRTGNASVKHKSVDSRTDILTRSSIKDYQNKMEEKARGLSGGDLQGRDGYTYVKDHTTYSLRTNNIPTGKQSLQHTSTADAWGVCRCLQRAVFLLVSLALGLMGYQHFSSLSRTDEPQNRLLHIASFETRLAELKALFPSQKPEFWKRAEIHLKRHLNLTNPTELVSIILTSGHEAEKTLGCLAQHLAAAFSNARNSSSVLSIDGRSYSTQKSDDVKLEIDKALKEAFEGGTEAAVIHHFEELPPGSTLIFYRYCDHENSAFKKVFLAFTVMLPELDIKLSLNLVEEQVHEYLHKRFVLSDKAVKFNQMDVDKLSGLWSRISHLILPVATEQKIEQQGCGLKAS